VLQLATRAIPSSGLLSVSRRADAGSQDTELDRVVAIAVRDEFRSSNRLYELRSPLPSNLGRTLFPYWRRESLELGTFFINYLVGR